MKRISLLLGIRIKKPSRRGSKRGCREAEQQVTKSMLVSEEKKKCQVETLLSPKTSWRKSRYACSVPEETPFAGYKDSYKKLLFTSR